MVDCVYKIMDDILAEAERGGRRYMANGQKILCMP